MIQCLSAGSMRTHAPDLANVYLDLTTADMLTKYRMNNNHGQIIDDDTSSDTDSVGGSEIHDPAHVVHEIPADPDTGLEDTELEDPAPMAHGSESDGSSVAETELDESAHVGHVAQGSTDDDGHDTAIAATPKRGRRNSSSNINSSRFFSNGRMLGTPTRAQVKRTRKLCDHLSPPRSCRLAMRRLEDHNGPP